MSIQGLKLAGAAISVWRGVKSTQAAPAGKLSDRRRGGAFP
jgi:hypothetical protein